MKDLARVERRKPSAAPKSAADRDAESHAAETFSRGVIQRGEAAIPDKSGKLPPGATHEIVSDPKGGEPVIKRRRFSAF